MKNTNSPLPTALPLAGLCLLAWTSGVHAFDTTLGSGSSANGTWSGNTWVPSAAGSVVSAAEVRSHLASGPVTIEATGGDDLTVAAPLAWADQTLTLRAGGDIKLQAQLDGTGTAGLALEYGQDAVTAGNAASYSVNAPVNLAATGGFSTQLGSDGTVKNYTILTSLGSEGSITGTDLQGIHGNLGGNYALGADIDASATSGWNGGAGFKPIGGAYDAIDHSNYYTGQFDGLGHVISGLTINRPSQYYIGLFGKAKDGARIAHVGLRDVSIVGNIFVGGLLGLGQTATIERSHVTGSVTGADHVGGILGRDPVPISSVSLRNVWSSADVTATRPGTGGQSLGDGVAGGLVGYGGRVYDSYATGKVRGGNHVGGLIGLGMASTVNNAYFSGTVGLYAGTSPSVGGIMGSWVNGAIGAGIHNVYWNTDTAGATGLAQGAASGTITNLTGLTTAQMRDAANFTGFTFTSTPGGDGWVLVGSDGTLNGNNGTVLPMLASEWSPVIKNTHQLQLMTLKKNTGYALAGNIDAADTNGKDVWLSSSFMPVGRATVGNFFTGRFDGQGHIIDGLTIDRSGTDYVGLFGFAQTGSLLRNVGLTNSHITGQSKVGALVGGIVNGSVATSYADGGSVSATGDNAGGLVGSIANGGSSVSNCFANISVSGANFVGGLVGINWGSLGNSHASGNVSGGSNLGGLVGHNYGGGTVANGYYADTTGQGDTGKGTRRTDTEMKQLATFAGWDIDDEGGTGKVWRIYDGHTYPLLRGFLAPLTATATSGSRPYDGTATGLGLTYSPAPDMAHLFGTLTGLADGAEVGSHAVTPAGLYSDQLGYDITAVAGTLDINAGCPGDSDCDGLSDILEAKLGTGINTPDTVKTGTPGADNLVGTGGPDLLDGGLGRDTLTGGAGADVLILHTRNDGTDLATDFQPGTDRISLVDLFAAESIHTTDPIGDGYIKAIASRGVTYLQFIPPGGRAITLMQFSGPLAAAALGVNGNFVY
ncbi:beta strand repeat-containing protein [Methylomagnum ishizawai]|uniref:beta strand repeat-containing protein n=1 Tax=Methylomagnum ishizawai TaxID=1760988 RepID=UPI001C340ADE|nr:hypothetical protein [Methylomagnum ishizawai]BBL74521.1 hypothetical protein MishRS11D_16190 [Methylomagnum ishizawai]